MRILLVVLLLSAQIWAQVTVQTPLGSVTGIHVDYGTNQSALWYGQADIFLGIPFAEPPVGDKRFQFPSPISSYPNGTVNESGFKPACVQPDSGTCSPQGEDCLYLNVFTPQANSPQKYPVMVWIHGGSFAGGCAAQFPYKATSAQKYPVMVWIHGGAFSLGCAQQFPVKGAVRNLVSRGVVVVTIQYRLNIPGFFTTSTDEFPANRGMLDQIEALKWVQNNIQYFGGNPYSVTIFGQSAGSISASAHTYSPLSRGLFQKAISQSGAIFTSLEGSLGTLDLSQQRAMQLCNFTQADWDGKQWDKLKTCFATMNPDKWRNMDAGTLFGWRMLQDNYFLPDTPENMNVDRPLIPIMLGNMHDEFASTWYYQMSAGVTFDTFSRAFVKKVFDDVATIFGARAADVWNVITKSYLKAGATDSDSVSWFRNSTTFFTAASFTQLIVKEIELWRERGNPQVYVYQQTYGSKLSHWGQGSIVAPRLDGYIPVPHSAELPFIWMYEGDWETAISRNLTDPFDFQLGDWYGETWTNFAKYSRPTLDDSWPPMSKTVSHFNIGKPSDGGMRVVPDYRETDRIVFANAIDQLLKMMPSQPIREQDMKLKGAWGANR